MRVCLRTMCVIYQLVVGRYSSVTQLRGERPAGMRSLLIVLAGFALLGPAAAAKSPSSLPRLSPTTIRRTVLCTLAVQNACQMLSMRYSRMPGQPKYLTSTAVVAAEATKIVAAFIVMLYNSRGRAFAEVWQGVFVDWRDTILVGVPAFLYLIQNNLLYVATTHLDAATCQAPPVCPTTCRRGRAPWRSGASLHLLLYTRRPPGHSKHRAPRAGGVPAQAAHDRLLLRHNAQAAHLSAQVPPATLGPPQAPPSARLLRRYLSSP